MGAADRTAQHLRIRAPNAQLALRATHRLQDALRCASLPDAGQRVLLVRRLHLGCLPEGLTSQSLSLLIEQRVAAVGGEWVHGDEEARAQGSNTVFFASRLQAAQGALRRRAQGLALEAWYWSLALPGVDVHAPAPDFLAQLLSMVERWPEAPAAWPALITEVVATGQGAWWRAQLPAVWRERLAPWNQRLHEAASPARRPEPAPLESHSTGALRKAPQPPVAREASTQQTQGLGADTHLSPTLHPHPLRDAPPAEPAQEAASPAKAVHEVDPPSVPTSAKHTPTQRSTSPTSPPAPVAPAPLQAEPVRAAATPVPIERVEMWADAVDTEAAGLLFVWPLLERLGASAWDALHPEACLAPRVLSLALERLRVPAQDPAWALCAGLPRTVEAQHPPDELAEQWLRDCRHHARRELRIGLASLVVRPGWLRWSTTHIDVHFRLHDADLRVRRAALDTDPGWVDALQRVLAFHYDHRGDHGGPLP